MGGGDADQDNYVTIPFLQAWDVNDLETRAAEIRVTIERSAGRTSPTATFGDMSGEIAELRRLFRLARAADAAIDPDEPLRVRRSGVSSELLFRIDRRALWSRVARHAMEFWQDERGDWFEPDLTWKIEAFVRVVSSGVNVGRRLTPLGAVRVPVSARPDGRVGPRIDAFEAVSELEHRGVDATIGAGIAPSRAGPGAPYRLEIDALRSPRPDRLVLGKFRLARDAGTYDPGLYVPVAVELSVRDGANPSGWGLTCPVGLYTLNESAKADERPSLRRLPLNFQGEPETSALSKYLIDYGRDYYLGVEISEIDHEYERLFDADFSPASIDIRLRDLDGARRLAMTIELSLVNALAEKFIISSPHAHRALVLPPGERGADFVLYAGKKAEGDFPSVKLINRTHRSFEHPGSAHPLDRLEPILQDDALPSDEYFHFSNGADEFTLREKGQPHLAKVTMKPLPAMDANYLAFDIGTQSIAAAWRDGQEQTPQNLQVMKRGKSLFTRLAETIPGFVQSPDADFSSLIPSRGAVTLWRDRDTDFVAMSGQDFVNLDTRLQELPRRPEIFAAAKERLLARAPQAFELHLPPYDTEALSPEDRTPLKRGFARVESAKVAIASGDVCDIRHAGAPLMRLQGEPPSVAPASELKSVELFADTLGTLLYAYLVGGDAPPAFSVHAGADNTYVLTYPASIGRHAIQRYREAGQLWLRRFPKRSPYHGTPSVQLVPEAVAACHAEIERLVKDWTDKEGLVVVFDIGAGTLDIAASDFEIQGSPAKPNAHETLRRASCSLPLGGDALDEALRRDVEEWIVSNAPGWTFKPDLDLAKRAIKTPAAFDVRGEPLAVPLRPTGLQPAFAAAPAPDHCPIDLTAPPPHTRAYLEAVSKLVVAPLFDMLLRPANGARPVPIKHILISGRASLFWPIGRAISEAIPTDELRKKLRWAVDLTPGAAYLADADKEKLKTVVARGAVMWAVRNADDGHTQQHPARFDVLAHVALVEGAWDGGAWGRIDRVLAYDQPFERRLNDGDLFAVLRPPGRVDALNAFSRDARSLDVLARALRPLRPAPTTEGFTKMDPLPMAEACAGQALRIARQGEYVRIGATVNVDGDITLSVVSGEVSHSYDIFSTFCA